MEKFSNWRDKGTGISPFLPVDPPASALQKYLINPAKLALKWPLFVALYYLAAVAPKPVSRFILTWVFSVSDIDLLVEGVRKSNAKQIAEQMPKQGEVVVSNLVSPLDIFVIFTISKVASLSSVAIVLPWKNDLYVFTVWKFLSVLFLPLESPVTQGTKMSASDIGKLKDKLVVLFPEGTASNNKAILKLQPVSSQVLLSAAKVVVLRYYPGALSLPVPHLTETQYVSKLLTLPGKAFVKAKIVPLQNPTLKSCQLAFVENGLNQVELGLDEKIAFFKYFQDYAVKPSK